MNQGKINRAFPSLAKLRDMNMPVGKARDIYKLYTVLEQAYNFAAGEEKKYLEQYNAIINEDGSVSFKCAEDCGAFKEKMDCLSNSEADIDIEAVSLSDKDIGNQAITPGDIYNLEGLVIFE